MKNPLTAVYEQVLLNEAEKHALQNPSSDEVGNLKAKAELFGTKPKVVEGPDKAKVKEGPKHEQTTGTTSKPTATKSSMPNPKPAKDEEAEEPEEMEDTDVDPTDEEEEETTEKKKEVKEESFTMSAFETLFKKTLNEEMEEEMTPETEMEAGDEDLELEDSEDMDLDEESEDEGDLISDLKDLQDKLASILAKLEDTAEESEDEDFEDTDYTENEFDAEFGDEEGEEEEEEAFKESVDKPKALNSSKGKALTGKKNKVGKVHPKGGKANGGKLKNEPKPKALGDKKAHLQKGKAEVKSSVKKGDFIK
jgi:hypothetical protein